MRVRGTLRAILSCFLPPEENENEPYGVFDPRYTVYSGQKNRTITLVVNNKNYCFECGELEEKHPLRKCKNFRPQPPPTG